MKRDYQREMEAVIAELDGHRPPLLLHACCAPCSSSVLERLTPHFDVTLFYYNPNIQPREEYERRWEQFPKLLRAAGLESSVGLLRGACDQEAFFEATRGLETEPEGGARCPRCFTLRLRETIRTAEALGAQFFATTLTVSPHKDAARINAIGEGLAASSGVRWLPSDFKKRDGYLRSIRLSEAYGLYRQSSCGCLFALGKPENKINKGLEILPGMW